MLFFDIHHHVLLLLWKVVGFVLVGWWGGGDCDVSIYLVLSFLWHFPLLLSKIFPPFLVSCFVIYFFNICNSLRPFVFALSKTRTFSFLGGRGKKQKNNVLLRDLVGEAHHTISTAKTVQHLKFMQELSFSLQFVLSDFFSFIYLLTSFNPEISLSAFVSVLFLRSYWTIFISHNPPTPWSRIGCNLYTPSWQLNFIHRRLQRIQTFGNTLIASNLFSQNFFVIRENIIFHHTYFSTFT